MAEINRHLQAAKVEVQISGHLCERLLVF